MLTKIEVSLTKDRSITVYNEDDVDEILEHNKTLRSMPQKSDWGRHIATIPNIVCVQWLNEEWQRGSKVRFLSKEWDQLVAKKLNDPDWKYLRTDK